MARYAIALKPLINIEDTIDIVSDDTPADFFAAHQELHGKCIMMQLNGGNYLCRETEWDKLLKPTDTVLIQVQPLRDPSSILVFVLNAMISSFATWAVASLPATYAAIAKAVIVMAGSMLINQLLPQPDKTTPQKIPDPSPTYSLYGNFNRERIGEAMPIRYGEGWATPYLAMGSYNEYNGGDQVFHALYLFGLGEYRFLHAKMQDTDISKFPGAEVEYVKPGDKVTLVPAQVYTASGVVSGNLTTDWTAAAVSCPAKTTVDQIGVDYVFARGLGRFDSRGKIQEHTVTLEWRYRLIDDAGNAQGGWQPLMIKSVTASTNSTVRGSLKAQVTPGRHEVQARRTEAEITDDNKFMDEAQWGGLRGYNNNHPDYGDVTLIALKIRVTEGNVQLVDNNTLQQFQAWYQKIIPVYDGGDAWTNSVSRNPVWILHHALTHKDLGRKDPKTIPLDEWKPLADRLDVLNHHFDFSFDQQIQLGEALQHIARAGRMKIYQHGGLMRLWRDEKREIAKQVFNPDNTWDFSLNMEFAKPDQPTGITVNYRNHATGKPAQVTFSPNDDKSNLQQITFTGCESHAHAWDEAAYLWQANSRNISGTFNTGLEAASLTYGDLIAVPSDETEITTWGHIVYQVGNTLYLSNPHGLNGAAVMAVNAGGEMQYIDIAPGPDADSVVASGTLPALTTGTSSRESSIYIIGTVSHPIILGHITKISPTENDSATIEFVALEQIWDTPPAPEEPTPPPSTAGKDLDCCDIKVRQEPDGEQFKLIISWRQAPDAQYFVLGVNQGGGNWQRIYQGPEAAAVYTAGKGAIQLRAAAFNQALGEFCYLDYEVGKPGEGTELPPPGDLALVGNFVCATLQLRIGLVKGAAAYIWKIYSAGENPVFRREIKQTGDRLDYDWQMNREDHTGRNILVKVWSVDGAGNVSKTYTEGVFNNPQIAGVTNIQATGFTTSIFVRWDYPSDCDTLGVVIHASQTSGFTPSPSTFVGEARGKQFSWGVPHGSTWYVRLAGFDAWGQDELVFSDEIEVTAQILNIEDFAGELPIDRVVGLLKTNADLQQALQDIAVAQQDIAVDRQSIIDAATERGTIKQSIITLNASTDAQFATVNQNLTAATTEREALSQSVLDLNTAIGNNHADLQNLQFALTTETNARSAAITSLTAVVNDNTSTIQSAQLAIATETQARANQYSQLDVKINNNSAAITTANNAIATETQARTNSITSLTASFGGQIAAISQTLTAQANDIGELTSRYVLKVQAGNNWGGQIIQGVEKPDGTGSVDVAFYADTFKVIANRNGQPVQMFMVNGTSVGINGNLLVNDTVTAEKIVVNDLAAVSADLGEITAGYIHSADSRFGINLNATGNQAAIRLKDLSNNTTFEVLKNGNVYSKGKFNIQEIEASNGVFDTIHIKNNAINTSVDVANNSSINPYRNSWRDVATVSAIIVQGDTTPRAHFNAMLNHGGTDNNNRVSLRLIVNNSEVWSIPFPVAGTPRENVSATVLLSSSGSVTVKLQAKKALDDGQGVVTVSHRFLSIQQTLR